MENLNNVPRKEWEATVAEDLHIAAEVVPSGRLTYTLHPDKPAILVLEVWDEKKENVLLVKHVCITVKNPPAGN